jgi:hypothetical protein
MTVPYTSHETLLAQVQADRAPRTPAQEDGWEIRYKSGPRILTIRIPSRICPTAGDAILLLHLKGGIAFEHMIEGPTHREETT